MLSLTFRFKPASDVDLAEKIYGPDIGTLKGKTTGKSPLLMETDIIELPPEITEDRSSWELCMDVMFVNGMPFLTSITRKLFYRTAQFIKSREAKHLYAALDDVVYIYNHNGFTIDKIYADREFNVGGISVGYYGADVRPVYWMSQWRRMTQGGCSSQ